MDILIKQIINDFHERKLVSSTYRETKLPQISGKVDTVIGMRRTGKNLFSLFGVAEGVIETVGWADRPNKPE